MMVAAVTARFPVAPAFSAALTASFVAATAAKACLAAFGAAALAARAARSAYIRRKIALAVNLAFANPNLNTYFTIGS